MRTEQFKETKKSKYGYHKRTFVACDDGSRICIMCLGDIDGCLNEYGPLKSTGHCYNCGLTVEKVEVIRG